MEFLFHSWILAPFVTLVGGLFKKTKIPLMGQSVIIALAYDVLLSVTSLKEYILTAPRVDIFSQNKEGIFSFIGYLAIFWQVKPSVLSFCELSFLNLPLPTQREPP